MREIAWEMLSTLESERDRENAVVFVERYGKIVIRPKFYSEGGEIGTTTDLQEFLFLINNPK